MDDEGAVNFVNQAVNFVNQEKGEKIKQKKKDKKSQKSVMDVEESNNADMMKAAASTLPSGNESISGVKRDRKKDKEKKTKKEKTIKGAKDAEADMKKGSSKGGLFVVSDENGGEGETDNAEKICKSSSGLTDYAERKRKRREKDKKEKSEMQETEDVKRDVEITDLQAEASVSVKESAEKGKKEKKKQKVKRDGIKGNKVGEEDGEVGESGVVNATEVTTGRRKEKKKKKKKKSNGEIVVEPKDTYNENKSDEADKKKKKKHKKKENAKDDLSAAQQEHVDNGTHTLKERQNDKAEPTRKREKSKGLSGNGLNYNQVNEAEHANKGKKRKSSLVVNGSDNTSPNKSNKKVRFSDQDEVFPLGLVEGKRFTLEEDQIVKDAVLKYIEEKDLGDEGLEMVINSSKHRELKGCWKEIASCIPYRPYRAVYYRAKILFLRSDTRKWTQEEYDIVKEYQKEHGNQWKALADELGKHTWHVKDTWRRIKLPNMNKGHWSQEEYQKLFDLVNTDLQLKISEEKRSKHGMLRDNICWTAISDELETRAQAMCCLKWYKQLTSPMVAEGVWSDSDDYRLLSALYSLDATCMEDVEWDDLIDNRSGEICRKRWNQMVLHIGHFGNKSFAEQVEVLAERYCPHLLEAREIWDNKPRDP